MKFGIALPNYGPQASPDDVLEFDQDAEKPGFDSAWTTDPTIPLKGSTQEVIDGMAAYREAGLEYPVIHFQVRDPAAHSEAMSRFVEEIVPPFQKVQQ